VERPRLIRRLEAAEETPLTLVAAEAGSGKTALVTAWFSRRETPTCWLSLDEGDSDPGRFWIYVIEAIRTAHPGVGEAAKAVLEARSAPLETVLQLLAEDLAGRRFALVIDDYHQVNSSTVDRSLDHFIDLLPSGCRVILISRGDPDLSLPRRRLDGSLSEIRCSDLRFTADEISEFYDMIGDGSLTEHDLRVLGVRTEGWVAGVQLGLIATQGHADPHGFVESFTGNNVLVADYLSHEVLDQQAADTREFLLATSSLNELTAELCAHVTDSTVAECHRMLRDREKSCLFVVPLDDKGQLYRYNNFFASAVRQRQADDYPEQYSEVNRRAAQWYSDAGIPERAIAHASRTGDQNDLADVIESFLDELLWGSPAFDRLYGWLQELANDICRNRPRLCLANAWILVLTGDPSATEQLLHEARSGIDQLPQDEPTTVRLRAEWVALKALTPGMSRSVTNEELDELQRVVARLETAGPVRAALLLGLADCYCSRGDLDRGDEYYAELAMLSTRSGNPLMKAIAISRCHDVARLRGDLTECRRLCNEFANLVEALDRPSPLLFGLLAWVESRIQYDLGELSEAKVTARNGIRRLFKMSPWIESGLHVVIARALDAAGDKEGAIEALRRSMMVPDSDWSKISKFAMMASIYIDAGDLPSARYWLRKADLDLVNLGMREERDGVVYATLTAAEGKTDQALELLARIKQRGRANGRYRCVIEASVAAALMLDREGNRKAALEQLEMALTLAAPHDYVTVFVKHGDAVAGLLVGAARESHVRSYARRLSHRISSVRAGQPFALKIAEAKKERDAPIVAEPLSRRETEVLALIAAGYANKEVAELLSLSPQTIKVHTRNIYAKLSVRNRTEAVRRARSLKFLRD
jgi:LuxR family maltose regulon positive regulatory protein